MNSVKLLIHDEINCSFVGLPVEQRRILSNRSKIFNPANRYVPSYRLGRWDGKTAYFLMGGSTYINLLGPMLEYLAEEGFQVELEDERDYNRTFEFDSIDVNSYGHINWPKGHPQEGQPIVLRDHQVEAANVFFQEHQGIAALPTASGKSLLTAILSHKVEKYGRSIVIVPNKDLITQTEAYYHILGLDVGVYYGDRKDFFKKHTICTWQSLERLRQNDIDRSGGEGNPDIVSFEDFMDGVTALIVDECHVSKAEKLSNMLTRELAKIPIRWALTGTIPKEPHEVVNLTIALGQVIHTLPSSELQERGILSQCDVRILQMIDTVAYTSYAAEYDYLVTDKKRLKFMAKLIQAASETGNVLVLVGRKETGRELESLIEGSIFLSGATKSKTRKEHYDEVKLSDSKVIIATAGIAAVGIDVPRLNHLFLIECGKSFVRTIQSCGRVLRTAFDKNSALIWDICSTAKYSKRHLTQRKKYYAEQKFPFTVNKVDWQQ